MFYKYTTKECEYIVTIVGDSLLNAEDPVEVCFVARVNGGRGRMPTTRFVPANTLELLVDYETARRLISRN